MSDQIIISVSREYGSGGHEIAQKLAEMYDLPLYDHNLLDELAARMNVSGKDIEEFDENRRNHFLYRSVRGMSSSPSENLALLQFDFMRKKAEKGESFVIVGRCSETVLRGNHNLISILVIGDKENKIERIMKKFNVDRKQAEDLIDEKDRRRKYYHNSHCKVKWGDSRNYDLSINSSRLSLEDNLKVLKAFIDTRIAAK